MELSPARIVAQLLVDLGVCGQVYSSGRDGYSGDPWPVAVKSEPARPDDVLTVYNTDPLSSDRVMGDNAAQLSPHSGIQVRVRSRTEPDGWDRAARLINAMNDVYRRTVTVPGHDPVTVHCFTNVPDEPTSLGLDKPASARHLYTVNAFLVLV